MNFVNRRDRGDPGIVVEGVQYLGPREIVVGTLYKVVLGGSVIRRLVEATEWCRCARCVASIVYPAKSQIVYALTQLREYSRWVRVVYHDSEERKFVQGFVHPFSLEVSVWSEPARAPYIWTAPYIANGKCGVCQPRPTREQWSNAGGDRVYEVREWGSDDEADVQLICDCRVYTLDRYHRCSGACGGLMTRYLKQEVFLRCLWQVLSRESPVMLCDDHCVHRALGMARVLELMTCAQVSYAGVGIHECIRERKGVGRRRLEWVCAYDEPMVFPWQVFAYHEFCGAHSVPEAVYVDPHLAEGERWRLWVAEVALDGSAADRLAGYRPPTDTSQVLSVMD